MPGLSPVIEQLVVVVVQVRPPGVAVTTYVTPLCVEPLHDALSVVPLIVTAPPVGALGVVTAGADPPPPPPPPLGGVGGVGGVGGALMVIPISSASSEPLTSKP